MEGGGFEPPKLSRQIYSLIPLTAREPLLKEALDSAFESRACQTKIGGKPRKFAGLGQFDWIRMLVDVRDACRQLLLRKKRGSGAVCRGENAGLRFAQKNLNGAATKSRTRDLLITNQLLYQLSYCGVSFKRRGL